MPTSIRNLLLLLVGLLPASEVKNRVLSRLSTGWSLADSAAIGPSLFWKVRRLVASDGARIGVGNVFRDLLEVRLGEGSSIGQFNWVSAAAQIYHVEPYSEFRSLVLGDHAAITSRHLLDCSGGVVLGSQSTLAGFRSTILSHGPDLRNGKMQVGTVRVGRACFISTNVTILKGCTIADRIVVSAGAVVSTDLEVPDSLYASPRVERVADMTGAAYFVRDGLRIDPGSSRPSGGRNPTG